MALKTWKKLTGEIFHTNPFWIYKIDKYALPDGKEANYYYCYTYGSVFIVPVTTEGRIIMLNQYRYLNDRFSIEFPGGSVKKDEKPSYAARKELIEETGYVGELEEIGIYNPCNGLTNEICTVFIAKNLKPSNEFIKDEMEEFEIFEYSVDEIEKMINSNIIYDGMTLAAWSLVRKRLSG